MPTIFKKIKAKAKSSRGGAAPDFIVGQFLESYDDWESTIGGLDEPSKTEIVDHFNEKVDGLGDALTEDAETFKIFKADMDAGDMKTFAVALIPNYFEIEGVDSVTD